MLRRHYRKEKPVPRRKFELRYDTFHYPERVEWRTQYLLPKMRICFRLWKLASFVKANRFQFQKIVHMRFRLRSIFGYISRRREKRSYYTYNIGYIRLVKTLNNLFISVYNRSNKLLYAGSLGSILKVKNSRRFSYESMRKVALTLAPKLHSLGLRRLNIYLHCKLRGGFRAFMWALRSRRIKVKRIINLIRLPHNGLTLPTRRRLKWRRRRR